MSTRRLEAFTDGVFAIAATLLVLDLTVNDLAGAKTDAELWRGLVDMWPAVSSFAISFFLLCLLWSIHVRQFEYIVHVDTPMLWLNTLRLFGVVLIPFTTSLDSRFGGLTLGQTLLPINFFWVVLFGYLLWVRAAAPGSGLIEGLSPLEAARSRRDALSAVILGAVVVIAAPFIGSWAFIAYAFDTPLSRLLSGRIEDTTVSGVPETDPRPE
ncbi:TMEM175 family protein [Leifsonia sp. YIM 134122]|uniref:TMEM175 family protein n=1 Tax=Leifsonia stereocauli TaxID=3134136 RepID=A0ABU9W1P6_9MICO